MAGDPFGPGNLSLGLRKGSPYKAALNAAMITLRGNGFIDVLRRQWLPADFCSGSGSQVSLQHPARPSWDVSSLLTSCGAQSSQSGVLEIQEITGLFYMLMLFMGARECFHAARTCLQLVHHDQNVCSRH